jgi:hypothetical protein
MFDSASRYAAIDQTTLTVTGADGRTRTISYIRRRFIAMPGGQVTLAQHRVVQGERIDNIAARYAGDPTQFWRLCDANGVLDPNDITSPPGRVIDIAMGT